MQATLVVQLGLFDIVSVEGDVVAATILRLEAIVFDNSVRHDGERAGAIGRHSSKAVIESDVPVMNEKDSGAVAQLLPGRIGELSRRLNGLLNGRRHL